MNTQKYKIVGCCGLLSESNRSMYKDKDTVSKSLIDKNKTSLNYNMAPNDYKQTEIYDRVRRILGRKPRKDAVMGSTIITLPKDYKGDTYDFFMTAYEGLKSIYKIQDEDVISSYVHLDETTPHMHFYFIPHQREYNEQGDLTGESCSWDKTVPRATYKAQHKKLEEYFKQNGREAHLLNGNTLGINLSKMTAEEKKRNMLLKAENKRLESDIERLQAVIDKIAPYKAKYGDISNMQATGAIREIKRAINKTDLLIKQGDVKGAEAAAEEIDEIDLE